MKTVHIKDALTLQPKHKWFSHTDDKSGDGWFGPFNTIEEAAKEAGDYLWATDDQIVFVAQGTYIKKKDRYADNSWEVDISQALEIRL